MVKTKFKTETGWTCRKPEYIISHDFCLCPPSFRRRCSIRGYCLFNEFAIFNKKKFDYDYGKRSMNHLKMCRKVQKCVSTTVREI